jgi:hypothetical protein
MKYLILTKDTEIEGVPPGDQWAAADQAAHYAALNAINEQLIANGELIGATFLSGRDGAKIVVSDGTGAPVISDGPFPEMKELLAGFQTVDVESEQRALEIAAQVSAAPGPGGKPLGQRIEVRAVMGGVDPEL